MTLVRSHNDSSEDVLECISEHKLAGEQHWPWVSVGHTTRQQGWKIHISCVPLQLPRLISHLAGQHRREAFPFKVIASVDAAMLLNEGSLGDSQIGKCATLYPEDDEQFVRLVERLQSIDDLNGPKVPDDVWLGGVIFARYGGFNPVIRRDLLGQIGRFVAEEDGSIVADRYDRALTLKRFQSKFQDSRIGSLLCLNPPMLEGLVNGRYLVIDVLRNSCKGALFQAFDISAQHHVRPLILKHGRAYVLSDRYGHDIRDRLRHQWAMHEIAAEEGIAPKCDSYFEIDGDGYLPIEFQKNDNFEAWVQALLQGQTIDHCKFEHRQAILSTLSSIGDLLGRLHGLGIVHRDLSPSNILLSNGERVVLSDLEIAWPIGSEAPVYGKGTPGFMAPEQISGATPHPSVDVHAYAALILYAVTGVDPRRLPMAERSDRWQSLSMLGQSLGPELWSIVRRGLASDPEDRPSIGALRKAVEDASQTGKGIARHIPPPLSSRRRPSAAEFLDLLHTGTQSLGSPALLDPATDIWLSAPMERGASGFGVPELRRSLNRGVAGVLYYCAQYERSYSLVGELRRLCQKNARWLIDDRAAIDYAMPGLHFGEAGVLVALYEARSTGVFDFGDAEVEHLWDAVLDHPVTWPDITHGAAGIILALEQLDALGAKFRDGSSGPNKEIPRYLEFLLASQNADGSWTMPDGVDGLSGQTLTGFAHGVAGIAYVLAVFGRRYADGPYLDAAIRAADWLLRESIAERDGSLAWPYSDTDPKPWTWWCHGGPGISSLFLALFRATSGARFRDAAARCFAGLPPHFNPANLSLCHGAAGIGELLLDAARGLDREDLVQRAEEIAANIYARHARGKRDVYWIVEDTEFVSGDLMVGLSGVLHFLLRMSSEDPHLSFPTGIGESELSAC